MIWWVDHTKRSYSNLTEARKRAYVVAQGYFTVNIRVKWNDRDRVGEVIETVSCDPINHPNRKPRVKFAEHKRAYFWLDSDGQLYRLDNGKRFGENSDDPINELNKGFAQAKRMLP